MGFECLRLSLRVYSSPLWLELVHSPVIGMLLIVGKGLLEVKGPDCIQIALQQYSV